MKKFSKYLPMAVFGLVAYICVISLSAQIYAYFTYEPLKEETKISAPAIPLEEVAITGPAVKTVDSPAIENATPAYTHSSSSWLLCEERAKGSLEAEEFFKHTAPEDPELAKYRRQAADARIKMIRDAAERYFRPQGAWGERLTDTLGIEPNSVILFSKGLVLYKENRYFFFHKAALEIGIEQLEANEKIAIRKGCDGNWYPAVERNDMYIPLTYWGELN